MASSRWTHGLPNDLNLYDKIDSLEDAVAHILKQLDLPKLETFHPRSVAAAPASNPAESGKDESHPRPNGW